MHTSATAPLTPPPTRPIPATNTRPPAVIAPPTRAAPIPTPAVAATSAASAALPPTSSAPQPQRALPAQGDPSAAGTTLPSYEDMLVEAITALEAAGLAHPAPTSKHAGQKGVPPRVLFHWMADRYPLMKNFRPSASQALQKSLKRGRFLKIGSLYRLNPDFDESQDALLPPSPATHPAPHHYHHHQDEGYSIHPNAATISAPGLVAAMRKVSRKAHIGLGQGANRGAAGQLTPSTSAAALTNALASSPKRDSRPTPKGMLLPVPAAPSRYAPASSSGLSIPIRPPAPSVHPAHLAGALNNASGGGGSASSSSTGGLGDAKGMSGPLPPGATTLAMLGLHHSRSNPLPSIMLQAANAYTRSGTVPLPGGVPRKPPLPASYTPEQREAVEREQRAVEARVAQAAAAAAKAQALAQAQAQRQTQTQAQAQSASAGSGSAANRDKRQATVAGAGASSSSSSSYAAGPSKAMAAALAAAAALKNQPAIAPAVSAVNAAAAAASSAGQASYRGTPPGTASSLSSSSAAAASTHGNSAQVQTELERLVALFKARGGAVGLSDEDEADDDGEDEDEESEDEEEKHTSSSAAGGPTSIVSLKKPEVAAASQGPNLLALQAKSRALASSGTGAGAAGSATTTPAAPAPQTQSTNSIQTELQRLIASLKKREDAEDSEDEDDEDCSDEEDED
ncbi:hypothetical protein V8E36_005272 [Tilletia maclaganii]